MLIAEKVAGIQLVRHFHMNIMFLQPLGTLWVHLVS